MALYESSIFIAVLKLFFLHVDVKERTRFFSMKPQFPFVSFCPVKMVGLIGLEPMTPALSRRCSNQLSYRPNVVDSGWLMADSEEFPTISY